MNVLERIAEVAKHYETIVATAAVNDKEAIEAGFHAEVSKIESMALGLIAQLKAKFKNAP